MSLLLDTNVISELRKGPRTNPRVRVWLSIVDTLMAATARVHGLILVTRNTRDVAWTAVPYLNPFEP